jgi:plasmid maintenance system antidote protein VapI
MDNEYNPDTFSHPSDTIGECLASYNMTVYSLVSLVDYCPLEYWQKYFLEQVRLTENAAIVLERTFNISRAFWLRLDDLYWQCVWNDIYKS